MEREWGERALNLSLWESFSECITFVLLCVSLVINLGVKLEKRDFSESKDKDTEKWARRVYFKT